MYGLPPDFDASVFVGHELLEVCFSANTIQLVFDENVSVTLEGAFAFAKVPSEELHRDRVPVESSALMVVAGEKVGHASSEPNGSLTLSFAGGATLVCLDDSPNFESYHVRIGDREIIV